jgi:uncharacterized protein (TIGR03067 family)
MPIQEAIMNLTMRLTRAAAICGCWLCCSVLPLATSAEDDEAQRDQAAYAGTWRAVTIEADGNPQPARERNIVVVNRDDGTWTLSVDGREVSSGTNAFDPLATPPAIDIEITAGDGAGSRLVGIYEIDDDRRRLCFRGEREWRPTEFATTPGSKAILVTFERE